MERLLDAVVPFLIFVVVIVRIVSLFRRRKHSGPERESPSARAAPPRAARGFIPWENEFRDAASVEPSAEGGLAQTAAADEDEAFSAWNLSVDDGPPALTAPAAPPRFPEAPGSDLFAAAPAAPPRFPEAPGSDPFAAAPAVPPRFPEAPGSDPSEAAHARSAPERLERRFRGLSPLQRGVIWAEILGAPRGLQD
jgi:hypothetical protein